jgi:hypothetical protein
MKYPLFVLLVWTILSSAASGIWATGQGPSQGSGMGVQTVATHK